MQTLSPNSVKESANPAQNDGLMAGANGSKGGEPWKPLESVPEWKRAADSPIEDGAAVLGEVSDFIRRYVSLTKPQADVLSAWALHSHALEAADFTPYLEINSPLPRSGKSRCLEVLELLVARPWRTGRTSVAALVRKVAQTTLLLDESDAAFQGDRQYAENLRGILNNGYERGGCHTMCVQHGNNWEPEDFPVFGAKAIAGIGRLPETVRDRSIPITLKRKLPGEQCQRFRKRKVAPEADKLRERLARFAAQNLDSLRKAEPALPETLNDRQQDVCEPLLAIADRAGGEWPNRIRHALAEIYGAETLQDDSVLVRLLSDIRTAFGDNEKVSTEALLAALTADQSSPWNDVNGKPLIPAKLAKMLAPLGIAPRTIRIGNEKTRKGYVCTDFDDAFARYIAPTNNCEETPSQSSQSSSGAGFKPFSSPSLEVNVTSPENPESLDFTRCVTDVTGFGAVEPKEGKFGKSTPFIEHIDKKVQTPQGNGTLKQYFGPRSRVSLSSTPERMTDFRTDDIVFLPE